MKIQIQKQAKHLITAEEHVHVLTHQQKILKIMILVIATMHPVDQVKLISNQTVITVTTVHRVVIQTIIQKQTKPEIIKVN